MSGEEAIPEQIDAIYSGSETALATTRNAAIGANNCTKIESSTIGIKTSSRRRMIFPKPPLVTYHSYHCLSRLLGAWRYMRALRNIPRQRKLCGNKFELPELLLLSSPMSNQKGKGILS